MNQPLAEIIFWIAAVACVIAEIAILRSTFASRKRQQIGAGAILVAARRDRVGGDSGYRAHRRSDGDVAADRSATNAHADDGSFRHGALDADATRDAQTADLTCARCEFSDFSRSFSDSRRSCSARSSASPDPEWDAATTGRIVTARSRRRTTEPIFWSRYLTATARRRCRLRSLRSLRSRGSSAASPAWVDRVACCALRCSRVVLVIVAALFGAVTVKLALNPLVVVTHLAIAMALLAVLVVVVARAGGLGSLAVAERSAGRFAAGDCRSGPHVSRAGPRRSHRQHAGRAARLPGVSAGAR